MISSVDALFAEINKYPLTAKVPTKIMGSNLRGKNELPLMSQSIANAIATGVWAISSPRGQANIQKTIERSVNRKFMPYINGMARANRKSLHHIYEWNKVGSTNSRLFDLVIPATSRGKANFSMRVQFRPSRTLVPLTAAQETPNPVTGAVVKRNHVFYNKAMVMEFGSVTVVRPKGDNYLAFDNPPGAKATLSGLTFTKKPVIIDYSKMPTYHALSKAIEAFFSGPGDNAVREGMNNYSNNVRRAAGRAAHLITVSTPSDAYAHAVAARMTEAVMMGG